MAAKICIHRFMIFLIIIAAAAATAAAGNANGDYVKVKFTKDLDVGKLTSSTYTTLIKDIRTRLAVTYSGKVPVMTKFTHIDPPGFDLVLTSAPNKTTVRFRGDNLYLVGYQMQTAGNKWLEFGKKNDKPKQLIQGSEFLEFKDDYPALEGIAGKVVNMELNQKKLIDSVANLAWSDNTKDRAEALLVLAQMISEAARFVHISNHFASNLGKFTTLPTWMRYDLENNWDKFSTMIRKSDADPSYVFPRPTIDGKVIQTVNDLRAYFGIIYRGTDPVITLPCSKSLYDEMKRVFEFEARRYGPRMVAQA